MTPNNPKPPMIPLSPDQRPMTAEENAALTAPETPRTDAAIEAVSDEDAGREMVAAEFARDLERALADSQAQLDEIRRRCVVAMGGDVCEGSGLIELVAVLLSQRANAYNAEDAYKARLKDSQAEVAELRAFAESVAENAEKFADYYITADGFRTEMRGFAEHARALLARTEGEA